VKVAETVDPTSLIVAYRLNGANFRASAKNLSNDVEVDGLGCPKKLTAIPVFYLASHAAELYLKAALLKRNIPERDLRKNGVRHNLSALIDLLLCKNAQISSQTLEVIRGLSMQHDKHALRYTVLVDDGMKTYWPPFSIVFSALDELLLLTRTTRSQESAL
jgi:hypothetical protein